jgi:23S rRNA (cytidine2498-2'-O)-methyltransferase
MRPGREAAPRADAPRPAAPLSPDRTPPRPGEWLFTTREGAEQDLADEFALRGEREPLRSVAPALVVSRRAPKHEDRLELTFARQGFPVRAVVEAPSTEALAEALENAIVPLLDGAATYALQVWVPDSTEANPLSGAARSLEERLEARLAAALPDAACIDTRAAGAEAVPLVQVCLWSAERAAVGALPVGRCLSSAPGGRARAHVGGDRPSRAARKVAEALAWLGLAPEPGELCIDLGAAPGGWTWFLLERRARVVAVDPAKLRPDLMHRKGLRYVCESAFDFEPDEPADFLFCDMAWRPLEVAQMLARWARNRWTTLLVANFKLPMKRKAEMVARIRSVLEAAGYRAIRTRQLYHDRDEITLTARVG